MQDLKFCNHFFLGHRNARIQYIKGRTESYSTKILDFSFFFHRDLGANLLREIRTGVFQYLEDLKVL